MGDLLDVTCHHRAAANSYHDHKERSAYAATTLYLAGVSVWLLSKDFWIGAICATLITSAIFTVISAVLVGLFVHWQLRNRRWAATVEAACIAVSTKILSGAVSESTPIKAKSWGGHSWPTPLADELATAEPTVRRGVYLAEWLTLAVIVLWTVLLLGRIVASGRAG